MNERGREKDRKVDTLIEKKQTKRGGKKLKGRHIDRKKQTKKMTTRETE